MALEIAGAANTWAARHPAFVEAMSKLEERGITAAVFSSVLRQIVSDARGLPSLRAPGDIDLLVQREHFDDAAKLLGASVVERQVAFTSGDGLHGAFAAREALVMVGGAEVQFMDPLSPVVVGAHVYYTEFTAEAAAARAVIETNEGIVAFGHVGDTLGRYGVMQRQGVSTDGVVKDDRANAAILAGAIEHGDPYIQTLAAEMGWDERVWDFVEQAGGLMLRPEAGILIPHEHVLAA